MTTLMREGGGPMWVILVVGAVALSAAVRLAFSPDARRLSVARWLLGATLLATTGGTTADLAAVFHHVPQRFADDPRWHFVLMQGLAESLAPAAIGLPIALAVTLLVALAVRRQARAAA
jgi:hypothetical protein